VSMIGSSFSLMMHLKIG